MSKRLSLTLCAALAAGGCETPGDALVARAEGYELSVNEAVNLLAGAEQLPNEANVVRAVSELWLDYVLLGEATRRDTTLQNVDVSPLVEQQVERRLILALRDSVIEADTAVTDQALRTLYEAERPGVTVEARHILLTVPENATAAQRDSVRRLAARIRELAATGQESFEDLAREYSGDPGTAGRGGELGTIERDQTLPAIEEAVFALEPGEVSDVVETPYGLHVFRVDERNAPAFEEIREALRREVQQSRHLQAESTYIAGMLEEASLRPVEQAADLTRRMADRPGSRLSRRASGRPVVEYDGGVLTLGEVLDFMQTSRPEYLGQIVQAPDDVVEDEVLLGMVQRELLLQQARRMGLSVSDGVRDSLTSVARERFVDAAGQMGLKEIVPAAGQPPREAVESRVEAILREMLSGDREVMPLGAIAYTLRKQFPNRVFESGVERVVQRVAEARGSPGGGSGPGGTPEGVPRGLPPTPPDSSEGG